MMKLFAGTFLLILGAFSGADALAASERLSFDPSSCWRDSDGKIIVRLTSGMAFAFEPTFVSDIVGWTPVVTPDLPPVGCPGNPLVFGGITYSSKSLMENALGALDFPAPERMSLLGHTEPGINLQKLNLRLFDSIIARFGVEHCEVLPENLEVCRACTRAEGSVNQCRNDAEGGLSWPKAVGYDRIPSFYRALPETYFEHDGLPFAGKCSWPVGKDQPRKCEFRYQIEDGVSVMYKINDFDVPEAEFISYDRHIRNLILSARAPQFDASPEEMERPQ